jgi:glycosyltransferase involved in cell wall biosynthesis
LAHGIEIWEPLSFFLKKILLKVDYVIAVSEYTKMKLIEINGVKPEKIKVKKNCLDPFFQFKDIESKPKYLFNRYQINPNNPVLLSVCRMSKNDRYKGYLNVLKSISIIKHILPSITYILAGSIEDDEKHLIHDLIDKLGISQNVLLIGYIDDDELIDHYKLANIFVMPSKREGFGIVFIEAAANGLNVIAGNEDASKEALLNGQLGVLVDPDNIEEIAKTILDTLTNPNHNTTRQNIVKDLYSFSSYSNDFLLIDTCLK